MKKPSWTKINNTANATPATATSVRVRSCTRLCQARGVRIAASGSRGRFQKHLHLQVDVLRRDGRLVERYGHLEDAAVGVGGRVDVEHRIAADDSADPLRRARAGQLFRHSSV